MESASTLRCYHIWFNSTKGKSRICTCCSHPGLLQTEGTAYEMKFHLINVNKFYQRRNNNGKFCTTL